MDRKLLIALCLSPLDVKQGLELLKLWADLEDGFNPSISVAICVRFDMTISRDIGQQAIDYASKKFKIYTNVSKRKHVGWPAGCNALEIDTYERFVEKNRSGFFDFEYLLIQEADTVPLRKGWAVEIMNEAYDNKVVICGPYFVREEGCPHINGNCVLHRNAWKKIKTIWQVPSRKGWDAHIGPQAISHGHPSRLIWQDYRLGAPDNPWKGDDFIFAPKRFSAKTNPLYGVDLQPAVIHGIKTLDGIKAVRRSVLGQEIP